MRRREFVASLGGAVFLALPVRAQTARFSRVGFLSAGNFELSTNPGRLTEEIVRQLAQSGFITGTNLELVKRGAEGHFTRLPALVAELVAVKVDVIVTFSYPVAAAAKEGTSTVPIVIFGAGDPVKTHLVDTLTFLNRKRVFEFAAEHRLPAIYETGAFAQDGGLMSYGPDEKETAEHGA